MASVPRFRHPRLLEKPLFWGEPGKAPPGFAVVKPGRRARSLRSVALHPPTSDARNPRRHLPPVTPALLRSKRYVPIQDFPTRNPSAPCHPTKASHAIADRKSTRLNSSHVAI